MSSSWKPKRSASSAASSDVGSSTWTQVSPFAWSSAIRGSASSVASMRAPARPRRSLGLGSVGRAMGTSRVLESHHETDSTRASDVPPTREGDAQPRSCAFDERMDASNLAPRTERSLAVLVGASGGSALALALAAFVAGAGVPVAVIVFAGILCFGLAADGARRGSAPPRPRAVLAGLREHGVDVRRIFPEELDAPSGLLGELGELLRGDVQQVVPWRDALAVADPDRDLTRHPATLAIAHRVRCVRPVGVDVRVERVEDDPSFAAREAGETPQRVERPLAIAHEAEVAAHHQHGVELPKLGPDVFERQEPCVAYAASVADVESAGRDVDREHLEAAPLRLERVPSRAGADVEHTAGHGLEDVPLLGRPGPALGEEDLPPERRTHMPIVALE